MIVFPMLACRQIEQLRNAESIVRALIDVNQEKDACLAKVLEVVHQETLAHQERLDAAQFYFMPADDQADAWSRHGVQ